MCSWHKREGPMIIKSSEGFFISIINPFVIGNVLTRGYGYSMTVWSFLIAAHLVLNIKFYLGREQHYPKTLEKCYRIKVFDHLVNFLSCIDQSTHFQVALANNAWFSLLIPPLRALNQNSTREYRGINAKKPFLVVIHAIIGTRFKFQYSTVHRFYLSVWELFICIGD